MPAACSPPWSSGFAYRVWRGAKVWGARALPLGCCHPTGCGSGKVFMALVQCSVLPPRGAPLPARSERRCLGWGRWRSPGSGEQGEPWLMFQGAGAGQPLDGDHRQPGLYLQHSPRGTGTSCVGSPAWGQALSVGTKGRAVCVQAQSSSGEWGGSGGRSPSHLPPAPVAAHLWMGWT